MKTEMNKKAETNQKTLCWYIHSFQLYFPEVTVFSSDRKAIKCTSGNAMLWFGHYLVEYAVVNESYAEFVLAPPDPFTEKGEDPVWPTDSLNRDFANSTLCAPTIRKI